jgi:hypothetical protein
LRWELVGQPGERVLVEASTDLRTWVPLVTLTNAQGRIEFTDPDAPRHPQRFYRASQP